MSIKISSKELAERLKKLKGALKSRTGEPTGILVKGNTLYAGSFELAIRTKLDMQNEETFVIPKSAVEFIENLPNGIADISHKGDSVLIKCGGVKGKYQTVPVDEFPEMKTKVSIENPIYIDAKELCDAFNSVLYAADENSSREMLQGVLLEAKSDEELDKESDEELDKESDEELDKESDEELDKESDEELDKESDEELDKESDEELDEELDEESDEELDERKGYLNVVGCDGYRMAWNRIEYDGEFKVIIPKTAVKQILSIIKEDEDVSFSWNNSLISFRNGDYEIISRVLDSEYMDYTKVAPKHDNHVELDRKKVIGCVKRAMICADNQNKLKLKFEGESLTVIAEQSVSESEETIDLQSGTDKPLTIGFNGKYLLDMFGSFNGDTLEVGIGTEKQPVTVKSGNLRALVLPVRLGQ